MRIRIIDGTEIPHPEDTAMIQSLYSRSPARVEEHIADVQRRGSGKFMGKYYIGFGHQSVGDGGSITIFIEDVSLLVAKAIQDNPLYSGQEASTRYMDFGKKVRPYVVPDEDNQYYHSVMRNWFSIYSATCLRVSQALQDYHPRPDDVREGDYQRAISARTFDICRSLLPIGTKTNLSWHTNLRQALDNLKRLLNHTLEEVRVVASTLLRLLHSRYPNSFPEPTEQQLQKWAVDLEEGGRHFLEPTDLTEYYSHSISSLDKTMMYEDGFVLLDQEKYKPGSGVLHEFMRERGVELPRYTNHYGILTYLFCIDFGSFRDLQRHRPATIPIPVVTPEPGFHHWYLSQLQMLLDPNDYQLLVGRITELVTDIVQKESCPFKRMYLFPMGLTAYCVLSCSIKEAVYIAELRSGVTVHSTARTVAWGIGASIRSLHPNLPLFLDERADQLSFRRGQQTIIEKSE